MSEEKTAEKNAAEIWDDYKRGQLHGIMTGLRLARATCGEILDKSWSEERVNLAKEIGDQKTVKHVLGARYALQGAMAAIRNLRKEYAAQADAIRVVQVGNVND